MPLSKARNAARMRNARALARGVQPSASQLMEVMSANQRKEKLAEFITTPINPKEITPSHIMTAIDIYNKMEGSYVEKHAILGDIRILIVREKDRLKEGEDGQEGAGQGTDEENERA